MDCRPPPFPKAGLPRPWAVEAAEAAETLAMMTYKLVWTACVVNSAAHLVPAPDPPSSTISVGLSMFLDGLRPARSSYHASPFFVHSWHLHLSPWRRSVALVMLGFCLLSLCSRHC